MPQAHVIEVSHTEAHRRREGEAQVLEKHLREREPSSHLTGRGKRAVSTEATGTVITNNSEVKHWSSI